MARTNAHISISDHRDLTAALKELGLSPRNTFCKHTMDLEPVLSSSKRFDDRHHGSTLIWPQGEFVRLQRMHEVLPGNVAKPIALVEFESTVHGYVLEYVSGPSLADYVKRASASEAVKAVETLSRMLDRLHQNGAAHGDATLNNVIVAGSGPRGLSLKLIDPFGIRDFEYARFCDIKIMEMNMMRAAARAYR